jgi:hypothetical protein
MPDLEATRLTSADQVSHAPLRQIQLRDFESVLGGSEPIQPVRRGAFRQENAIALLGSTANASPELVELRQAEPFRMLDQHDRCGGYIDAYLDHGGCHQHLQLSTSKTSHDRVPLFYLQPPMYQAHLQLRPSGGKALRHRGSRP